MAKSDALISGSFALQFFERSTWLSSDLDMYVRDGESSEALSAYLVESEGYSLESTKGSDEIYQNMGVRVTIRTYLRPVPGTKNTFTEVQVIATPDIPIRAILEGFYTTVVVNVISWNKAYSVYPLTTFNQYRGYLLKELDEYTSSFVSKYTQRGWKIQELMWPEDRRINHPIQELRRIGDRYTWIIPLDVSNVMWSRTPDFVLEHACFRIEGTEKDYPSFITESEILYYRISASMFVSPALRYRYTYHASWCYFLGERVTRMASLELRKMKPQDRPPNYQGILEAVDVHRGYNEVFVKPGSWTCWDSEIPRWYKA